MSSMVRTRNLTDQAHRTLRHAIMTGVLLPGSRISEAYLAANHAFHRAVVDAAGSERISRMVAELLEHSQRIQHVMLNLRVAKPLPLWRPALIDALVAQDGQLAASIMVRHLDAVRARALEILTANPTLNGSSPSAGRGRAGRPGPARQPDAPRTDTGRRAN